MYLMVATGYTMSFYVAQILWENAQLIAMQYRNYVIYYILSTALTSFIICYRFGPVTNKRTKNIIQWVMQVKKHTGKFSKKYLPKSCNNTYLIFVILAHWTGIIIS